MSSNIRNHLLGAGDRSELSSSIYNTAKDDLELIEEGKEMVGSLPSNRQHKNMTLPKDFKGGDTLVTLKSMLTDQEPQSQYHHAQIRGMS